MKCPALPTWSAALAVRLLLPGMRGQKGLRLDAAYNHALYLESRTKMMQDWADFLEQTQQGGKVLPFRGSAA